MKVLHTALPALIAFGVLSACGQGQEEAQEQSEQPASGEEQVEAIEVEILTEKSQEPGEEFELKALVTQGDEKVNDANEVVFEVWKEGEKEESDMVEATDVNEGIYTAPYTIEEVGEFVIQPHVTARGMHRMPTQTISTGDAEEEHSAHGDHEDGDDHDHDHHHEHDSDILSVDFAAKEGEEDGESLSLIADIEKENETLTEAEVQFEIWQHGDEAHSWVKADEIDPGSYHADHLFEEEGEYHIVIHIENEELHEHISESVEVK
ncbi:FixH family protein [Thalassobacillus sp. C254]|uniref:FixH family protein n=1 Tax=Thalassobacillus sp. C254 TaxID=1225341 RepID=UPI0006D10F98|nr:FixH family protein [Thalassobacillus sp. C254]